MKKLLFRFSVAAVTAGSALSVVSCAYDPYAPSYYGGGYGYSGGSSFSATFVSTGDSRWGYDPDRYCYYDYTRRAYYDPYLYGYYPVGYLPPRLYGVPHPHGWRPGRTYCPPPRNVRFNTISNYQNRVNLLQRRNYGWANHVRVRDRGGFNPRGAPAPNRNFGNQPNRPDNRPGFQQGPGFQNRPDSPGRPQFGNPGFQNRPTSPRPGFFNNRPESPRPQPTRPSTPPRAGRPQPGQRPALQYADTRGNRAQPQPRFNPGGNTRGPSFRGGTNAPQVRPTLPPRQESPAGGPSRRDSSSRGRR